MVSSLHPRHTDPLNKITFNCSWERLCCFFPLLFRENMDVNLQHHIKQIQDTSTFNFCHSCHITDPVLGRMTHKIIYTWSDHRNSKLHPVFSLFGMHLCIHVHITMQDWISWWPYGICWCMHMYAFNLRTSSLNSMMDKMDSSEADIIYRLHFKFNP